MKNKSDYIQQSVDILKALAHPVRLQLLMEVIEKKRICVTELQQILGIEQAIVSQQLTILRRQGVLESEKQGKQCYYIAKKQGLEKIIRCLEEQNKN